MNLRPSGYEPDLPRVADLGKRAKRLLRAGFWFSSSRVLSPLVAPSRAMDARWTTPVAARVEASVTAISVRFLRHAITGGYTDRREDPYSRAHNGAPPGKTLLICNQCQTPSWLKARRRHRIEPRMCRQLEIRRDCPRPIGSSMSCRAPNRTHPQERATTSVTQGEIGFESSAVGLTGLNSNQLNATLRELEAYEVTKSG